MVIRTVDMHTGGEPVRIVTDGYPPVPGETILDKRRHARDELDHLRRLLMWEPRGHVDMYGVIPVEPDDPQADLAVLFMHNEGYSTMCGHAALAIGRWAVDSGRIAGTPPSTRFALQVPAGTVEVTVETTEDGTRASAFRSMPAFAYRLGAPIEVPGHGTLSVDIGYGGAFYAFIAAAELGLNVAASPIGELVAGADRISGAVTASVSLSHPESDELGFLYGTILTDGGDGDRAPSTNVCVFADRQVDRSPTGSGVMARLALQYARDETALGEERRFRSVTGSVFTGTIAATTTVGEFPAVVVDVGGRAYYTGRSEFTVEDDDPLPGFLVR